MFDEGSLILFNRQNVQRSKGMEWCALETEDRRPNAEKLKKA
jgi:hypothetical protein